LGPQLDVAITGGKPLNSPRKHSAKLNSQQMDDPWETT
jgi:hypothetical protein